MYQIEGIRGVIESRQSPVPERHRWWKVGRPVFYLGLTSLFTDISAEMVSTILPLYLVFSLNLPPLQFGILDGIYQGGAALVRVASGFAADRWNRYKEVAVFGYTLSAICKPLFLLAGSSWFGIAALVLLDRTGKGIRTAPRDALISLHSSKADLGTAFGVHRALDTVGAMLGPLVAFGILALIPAAYDVIFVASFCFALIGLAIIALLIRSHEAKKPVFADAEQITLPKVLGLLWEAPMRRLVWMAVALNLSTISESFLYLELQRGLQFPPAYLPLMYVGTAISYIALAIPIGRLADLIGRERVFLAGYGFLLLIYLGMLLPFSGPIAMGGLLLLFGGYFAATDGVLMALSSAMMPVELRASGLSMIATASSLAKMGASVLFGLLWGICGLHNATLVFLGFLSAALITSICVLKRPTNEF